MGNETYKIPIEQSDEDRKETKLKLTRRGKLVLAATLAVPAGLAVAGGAYAMHESNTQPTPIGETVVVVPGDDLWGIAQELAPNMDPRDVIDELMAVNPDIEPGSLQPGQVIQVPVDLVPSGEDR